MSRYAVLLLVAVAMLTISMSKGQTCRRGEQWNSCGGCEETCADINGPPRACTAMCRVGCQCRPNFVRHNGRCIPRQGCPQLNG